MCPRLVERFLYPHPLMCRVWSCRRPIAWRHPRRLDGGCDAHRLAGCDVVPVAIYGREGEGWLSWPRDVLLFVATERRP